MGTTSPTTGFEQPSFSILRIMRGSADSEEDVPSTMKISSLDVAEELEEAEAAHSHHHAEHHHHEQDARGVEAGDELARLARELRSRTSRS